VSRRVGLVIGAVAGAIGVGLVVGAARVASAPAADVPVVCVMAAAASDGVPVPAPHAWERRCS
jgi:hypothetical protein